MCGYDQLIFNSMQVNFLTSQHLPSDIVDATNYRTLTNLRVRLLDQFVELMISGQRFQYYSVSEWLIWGSCLCNGHAASCTPGVDEKMATDKVESKYLLSLMINTNACSEI